MDGTEVHTSHSGRGLKMGAFTLHEPADAGFSLEISRPLCEFANTRGSFCLIDPPLDLYHSGNTQRGQVAVTSKRPNVVFVVGARPNYMKVASLWKAASARNQWDLCLVNTGQHYDPELSRLFIEQLEISPPRYNLEVGSGSHADQTGRVMIEFEKVLAVEIPDLVVVVGDVNSTLACALVAVKLGIPVAHVEAGLRSFDRTMPEEINRLLTDAISDYLFATEPDAVENLRREGVPPDKVFLVGNVLIDTLNQSLSSAAKSPICTELGLRQGSGALIRYALLTLHRPSNVDSRKKLEHWVGVMKRIAELIPLVFPMHPRTRSRLAEAGLLDALESLRPRVILTAPVGYLDFLALMQSAHFVLTDSGGIQEETTALRIPCLTLRENTERWITVTQGSNEIVGTDPAAIIQSIEKLLRGDSRRGCIPELWDGAAAQRVISILAERLSRSLPRGAPS